MDNSPFHQAPEELEIEEMLSHIRPQPTSRFYKKMRSTPWERPNMVKTSSALAYLKSADRLVWGLLALILIVGVVGLTFIPSVRAIARQFFYSFIHSPSNQIQVQVTPAAPGDLYNFSDPSNFTLSVPLAQQQAGFGVKEISVLPEGLTFIGCRFDSTYNAVTLQYQGNDYKLFLTQRPRGNGQDVFSIGASANVESVKIGEIQGEFVVGGWKVISQQPDSSNQTPTSVININAIWDNDLPQSTLRWQTSDIVYELRSVGEGNPSLSDLINLANGLK